MSNEIAAATQKIRDYALAHGFQAMGFARAEALDHERSRLNEWLRRGYQSSMAWLEREPDRRTDPRQIFPGARSVVTLIQNYYTPTQHESSAGMGKISRYAWGDDYHKVMGDALHGLLHWIETEWPGVTGKVCLDIQPMMDKAWAVRAGLGWIGKHTNLITTTYGSWVFIGELLLDMELDYVHETVEDHCGTCTACIDACPTAAIVEPYVLDANKCISYATIECRDDMLPAEVAAQLDGWIYGCDVCQDVCPWNRFAQPSDEHSYQPRNGEAVLRAHDVTKLDQKSYAARFRNSAMKRAKLFGLQRNARALLNSADECD